MFSRCEINPAKIMLAEGDRRCCRRIGSHFKKLSGMGKSRFFKTQVDVRMSFGFYDKKKTVLELCPSQDSATEFKTTNSGFKDVKKQVLSTKKYCTEEEEEEDVSRRRNSLRAKANKSAETNSLSRKRSRPALEFNFHSNKRNKLTDPSSKTPEEEELEEGEIVESESSPSTRNSEKKSDCVNTTSEVSHPKSENDEGRALRTAMILARFSDTILRSYDKTKTTKTTDDQCGSEKKESFLKGIAAAEIKLKTQRQREREAARIALENMKPIVEFNDAIGIQREFEKFIGAPSFSF